MRWQNRSRQRSCSRGIGQIGRRCRSPGAFASAFFLLQRFFHGHSFQGVPFGNGNSCHQASFACGKQCFGIGRGSSCCSAARTTAIASIASCIALLRRGCRFGQGRGGTFRRQGRCRGCHLSNIERNVFQIGQRCQILLERIIIVNVFIGLFRVVIVDVIIIITILCALFVVAFLFCENVIIFF